MAKTVSPHMAKTVSPHGQWHVTRKKISSSKPLANFADTTCIQYNRRWDFFPPESRSWCNTYTAEGNSTLTYGNCLHAATSRLCCHLRGQWHHHCSRPHHQGGSPGPVQLTLVEPRQRGAEIAAGEGGVVASLVLPQHLRRLVHRVQGTGTICRAIKTLQKKANFNGEGLGEGENGDHLGYRLSVGIL